jgi:hypothetical protein
MPKATYRNALDNLLYEAAPSFRPEGMDDFEDTGNDGRGTDEHRADELHRRDIAQDEYSYQDQEIRA